MCRRRERFPLPHGKVDENKVCWFRDKPMGDQASTTGGTDASSGPGSSRPDGRAASGCTRPAHRRSACPRATGNLKAAQKLLGHAQSRPRATSTPTGTSTNSPTRPGPCWRARTESFPPSLSETPANRRFMEAAGIEPASADAPDRASTSVVRLGSRPTAGGERPTGGPAILWMSRFGRLALPPHRARWLAPPLASGPARRGVAS